MVSYPIEVLLFEQNGKVNVYTKRQVLKMDMYFLDAEIICMPTIIDSSLRRTILGGEYSE